MSESHLTLGRGPSSDQVIRPKVNTGISRHTSEAHPGRLWIRTGLAGLPPELISTICKHLCGCWHCGPKGGAWAQHVRVNVQYRNAINSLSRTCRFLCYVAQPYLFHVLETAWPDENCDDERNYDHQLITVDRFRSIPVQLPHIVSQIRRITLSSITDDLLILRRLTGLGTLRLLWANKDGDGFQTRLSFPCLQNFFFGPEIKSAYRGFKGHKVELKDAKKDLQAILGAAQRLSCLECYRLWHDVSSSPITHLKLPASHITDLKFGYCWFPHQTLKHFMANFPRLKAFLLWGIIHPVHIYPSDRATFLMPAYGSERVADAVDVVEALEPCREILDTLTLNFGHYHADRCFRSLSPVKTFTGLRTLTIHQNTLRVRGQIAKDILFKLIPNSITFLSILEFAEDFNSAILEFAKHLAEGEYPNLQRLLAYPGGANNDRLSPVHMSGKTFLAFASGQDVPRLEAHSDHPGIEGIDIDPHQRLRGEGGDEDADDREVSEDGGLEEDVGIALNPDGLRRQQEWVWFGRSCLKDNLMPDLVRRIQEDSKILIRFSLQDISLRKEIRLLLSKTNVRLLCGAVYTRASGERDRFFCALGDASPINRRRGN